MKTLINPILFENFIARFFGILRQKNLMGRQGQKRPPTAKTLDISIQTYFNHILE